MPRWGPAPAGEALAAPAARSAAPGSPARRRRSSTPSPRRSGRWRPAPLLPPWRAAFSSRLSRRAQPSSASTVSADVSPNAVDVRVARRASRARRRRASADVDRRARGCADSPRASAWSCSTSAARRTPSRSSCATRLRVGRRAAARQGWPAGSSAACAARGRRRRRSARARGGRRLEAREHGVEVAREARRPRRGPRQRTRRRGGGPPQLLRIGQRGQRAQRERRRAGQRGERDHQQARAAKPARSAGPGAASAASTRARPSRPAPRPHAGVAPGARASRRFSPAEVPVPGPSRARSGAPRGASCRRSPPPPGQVGRTRPARARAWSGRRRVLGGWLSARGPLQSARRSRSALRSRAAVRAAALTPPRPRRPAARPTAATASAATAYPSRERLMA